MIILSFCLFLGRSEYIAKAFYSFFSWFLIKKEKKLKHYQRGFVCQLRIRPPPSLQRFLSRDFPRVGSTHPTVAPASEFRSRGHWSNRHETEPELAP